MTHDDHDHHHHHHGHDARLSLTVFSPAGVVAKAPVLRRAAKRLGTLGFEVEF